MAPTFSESNIFCIQGVYYKPACPPYYRNHCAALCLANVAKCHFFKILKIGIVHKLFYAMRALLITVYSKQHFELQELFHGLLQKTPKLDYCSPELFRNLTRASGLRKTLKALAFRRRLAWCAILVCSQVVEGLLYND